MWNFYGLIVTVLIFDFVFSSLRLRLSDAVFLGFVGRGCFLSKFYWWDSFVSFLNDHWQRLKIFRNNEPFIGQLARLIGWFWLRTNQLAALVQAVAFGLAGDQCVEQVRVRAVVAATVSPDLGRALQPVARLQRVALVVVGALLLRRCSFKWQQKRTILIEAVHASQTPS